ncbi:hypothetical protein [Nocardia sp. NPDC019395]|uniref:tetratricopeptide repeat protein n=1 Tax=Nocardia sp. NPDC019395 TaxID=3154686 RepID=UPI0033DA346E
MHDPVSSVTGFIPSQADRPEPAAGAGQLPRYLRGGRHYATSLLTTSTRENSAPGHDPDRISRRPTLAARYLSADPIDFDGAMVYPMYSEQLPTPASALTMTLLSATPPAGLGSVGIGLSVVDGYIDLDHRHVAGVDIWRDALERGITFDLAANAPGALFALTPVWTNSAGEPQSWSGNYGIVVERTETGRTVLWCSMGEGPPHFADLVVEVRSTSLDPHPQLFMSGSVPAVSIPAAPAPDAAPHRYLRVDPPATEADDDSPDPWAAHYEPAADEVEIQGYPCSFADIVLPTPDGGAGPDDLELPGTMVPPDGADGDFSGYDDPLAAPVVMHEFPAGADPETYPRTGRHAWVENPEMTGLVPVVRDTALTDYGPEPPRTAGTASDPGPDATPLLCGLETTPVLVPSGSDHSLVDTLADDSLAPVPPGNETQPADELDADRLHTLGAIAAAQGDDDRAYLLWTRAARAGHLGAAYELGLLHMRRDEPEAAERWLRAAAGRRLIAAMADLSILLEHRGVVAEARMWRTQAVAEEVIATATRAPAGESLTGAQR